MGRGQDRVFQHQEGQRGLEEEEEERSGREDAEAAAVANMLTGPRGGGLPLSCSAWLSGRRRSNRHGRVFAACAS